MSFTVEEMQEAVNDKTAREIDKLLSGKKVKVVRRMTKREADGFGWDFRPIVVVMEDGTFLVPQSDDEGNDAGALLVLGAGREVLGHVA